MYPVTLTMHIHIQLLAEILVYTRTLILRALVTIYIVVYLSVRPTLVSWIVNLILACCVSLHIPSFAKKGPWAEHLTSLPKRGAGALLTVSTFNHKRVPTSCLQWLNENNWTPHSTVQSVVCHHYSTSKQLVITLYVMWRWAYCSSQLVSRLPSGCSPH